MEKIKNIISGNLPPHTHGKLRKRVIFAVLHAMIPLLFLSFYAYLGQREHSIKEAEQNAGYIVEVAAQAYQEKIKTTESILKVISNSPEVKSGSASACNSLMENLLKEFPPYVNFGVTDEKGFIYCSGLPITQKVDARDRSWYLETLKNEGFSIGTYQTGHITKEQTINFGYPLREGDKVSGVMFAALDLEWIKDIADNFRLPYGSAITVVDRDGTVLARFPEEEGFVGTNQKDNPLVKKVIENGEKGSMLEKGLDGVERYYSYAKIQESSSNGDFYLYIGAPRSVLSQAANKAFAVNFAIILGVLTLAVVIAIIDWEKFVDEEPTSP